jgi:hypothetical protein
MHSHTLHQHDRFDQSKTKNIEGIEIMLALSVYRLFNVSVFPKQCHYCFHSNDIILGIVSNLEEGPETNPKDTKVSSFKFKLISISLQGYLFPFYHTIPRVNKILLQWAIPFSFAAIGLSCN